MAVPSTNILFSDIWSEANGGIAPSTMLSLDTMSYFSYFEGPSGATNLPDNNWGQGQTFGVNRIYGTTAITTNIKVGDFKGLDYFYDESAANKRYVQLAGGYAGPSPTMPPDPPDVYDFTVNLLLMDRSLTYPYCVGGGFLTPTTNITQYTISIDRISPMINTYWWQLDVNTSPMYPGSSGTCTVELVANGTTIISPTTLNNGLNSFNYLSYSTASISLNQPASGDTGSLWQVTIN